MGQKKKQTYLVEAIRIGDELLSLAEYDGDGVSWKTYSPDKEGNLAFGKTGNLYSGSSGIALFFIELYKQTHKDQYKETAVRAISWADKYYQTNPTTDYSLYCGQMGVSYAFLKLFQTTTDPFYLEKALTIAKSCSALLKAPFLNDDIITGTSGTILGLLHLHAAAPNERWLLEIIDQHVEGLINRVQHGPAGLFWGRSGDIIKGLCGFAHGSSGIGYVFLELGDYFQDGSYYWLAEQAFMYETHYYKEEIKNWPDFICISDANYSNYKKELLSGNNANFLYKNNEMNAWCHGASGIGLSRLRAFELLQKKIYIHEVKNVIEKIVLTDLRSNSSISSFTLCHGSCGNAELLIESYTVLGNDKLLAMAYDIADKALRHKTENKIYLSGYPFLKTEELSLFSGIAGIGYFYLRLIDPQNVPSILSLKLKSTSRFRQTNLKKARKIKNSIAEIKQILVKKYFHRTLFIINKLLPWKVEKYFNSGLTINVNEDFSFFIESAILTALSKTDSERVVDIYMLEKKKREKDLSIPSYALLSLQSDIYKEKAAKLFDLQKSTLMKVDLILNPDIEILFARWNWDKSPEYLLENLSQEPKEFPVLLKPTVGGVADELLLPLSYSVAIAFKSPKKVADIILEIETELNITSSEQKKQIRNLIFQQILEAIAAQILIEP